MNKVDFIRSLPCLIPKVTMEELIEGSIHPGFTSSEQYVMRQLLHVLNTHECKFVQKTIYVNERDYLHALAYYCTNLVFNKMLKTSLLRHYLSVDSSGIVPIEELNICWFVVSYGANLDDTSLRLFFPQLVGLISHVRNCHGNRWKVKEILGSNVFIALELIAMISSHFRNI